MSHYDADHDDVISPIHGVPDLHGELRPVPRPSSDPGQRHRQQGSGKRETESGGLARPEKSQGSVTVTFERTIDVGALEEDRVRMRKRENK